MKIADPERQFLNLLPPPFLHQGKITKYTFEGLEPDCVYLIQVQALIQYGDTKLRSKKANLFVTTFSAEKNLDDFELFPSNANEFQEEEEEEDDDEGEEVVSTPAPIPDPILNLTHENPFFKDGVIKAKIKWAPINRENTRQVSRGRFPATNIRLGRKWGARRNFLPRETVS